MRVLERTNARGTTLRMIPLGATIIALETKDGTNLVVGLDDPESYREEHPYLGSTIGRFCNRIANARFTLDGVTHALTPNDGPHSLHGGPRGFARVEWDFHDTPAGLLFTYRSADGEEGFPGNLDVQALYELTDDDELFITCIARTDAPTVVNLTNHAYWNLNGEGTAEDHLLTVHTARYLEVDETLIPTREASVEGTPLDFRVARRVGDTKIDHCYVLTSKADPAPAMRHAARLESPATGRAVAVRTTQPGLQIYTGDPRGIALESQHFPDSPNRPDFPSTVLLPDKPVRHLTVYRVTQQTPRS